MAIIDGIIVAVVVISALISITRGFVKEMLSLLSWLCGFIIARAFSGPLDGLLSSVIETPSLRYGISFAGLFIATLIVGALINHLVGELVDLTGLTGTDRVLGVVFGVARGLVLVTAIIYGLQFMSFHQDPWWQESWLIPHFEQMVEWSKDTLPGASEHIMAVGHSE